MSKVIALTPVTTGAGQLAGTARDPKVTRVCRRGPRGCARLRLSPGTPAAAAPPTNPRTLGWGRQEGWSGKEGVKGKKGTSVKLSSVKLSTIRRKKSCSASPLADVPRGDSICPVTTEAGVGPGPHHRKERAEAWRAELEFNPSDRKPRCVQNHPTNPSLKPTCIFQSLPKGKVFTRECLGPLCKQISVGAVSLPSHAWSRLHAALPTSQRRAASLFISTRVRGMKMQEADALEAQQCVYEWDTLDALLSPVCGTRSKGWPWVQWQRCCPHERQGLSGSRHLDASSVLSRLALGLLLSW